MRLHCVQFSNQPKHLQQWSDQPKHAQQGSNQSKLVQQRLRRDVRCDEHYGR